MASSLASQSLHLYTIGQQKARSLFFISCYLFILLTSCSVTKQISKQAQRSIFTDSNFNAAHIGISIYDPSTNKYLYNYQGDKYFIPASNTKLFSCYAAMKHLGDSLVGLKFKLIEKDSTAFIESTGDPTFLHPDFSSHPVFEFLKRPLFFIYNKEDNFRTSKWGNGWAWNDYQQDYMAERSAFPIYGNLITLKVLSDTLSIIPKIKLDYGGESDYNEMYQNRAAYYRYWRSENENIILWDTTKAKFTFRQIPMFTSRYNVIKFINDTLHNRKIGLSKTRVGTTDVIHSHPTDSLLKPMMHRSDNFFAEQSLLMVSNKMLGVMNDSKIIDSLLKTDLKDLPQKPRWVDGSGLSRYNNFTPQSFVSLLNKMKNEFDWNRITTLLPTGNEGTLSGLYKDHVNRIYAKTGTLSGQVALSGYLITKKNKTLIFSVLVNNHQASAGNIRRAIEKFLTSVIEKY